MKQAFLNSLKTSFLLCYGLPLFIGLLCWYFVGWLVSLLAGVFTYWTVIYFQLKKFPPWRWGASFFLFSAYCVSSFIPPASSIPLTSRVNSTLDITTNIQGFLGELDRGGNESTVLFQFYKLEKFQQILI